MPNVIDLNDFCYEGDILYADAVLKYMQDYISKQNDRFTYENQYKIDGTLCYQTQRKEYILIFEPDECTTWEEYEMHLEFDHNVDYREEETYFQYSTVLSPHDLRVCVLFCTLFKNIPEGHCSIEMHKIHEKIGFDIERFNKNAK